MQAEAGRLYLAGERSLDGAEAPGRAVGVTHSVPLKVLLKHLFLHLTLSRLTYLDSYTRLFCSYVHV